jgi:hypothetical protein
MTLIGPDYSENTPQVDRTISSPSLSPIRPLDLLPWAQYRYSRSCDRFRDPAVKGKSQPLEARFRSGRVMAGSYFSRIWTAVSW